MHFGTLHLLALGAFVFVCGMVENGAFDVCFFKIKTKNIVKGSKRTSLQAYNLTTCNGLKIGPSQPPIKLSLMIASSNALKTGFYFPSTAYERNQLIDEKLPNDIFPIVQSCLNKPS